MWTKQIYTIHHQLLQKNSLRICTNFDNWLQKLKTRAQHFIIYLHKNFQPVWWCSECDSTYANHKWTKISDFKFLSFLWCRECETINANYKRHITEF
jgi:hypothetical protein